MYEYKFVEIPIKKFFVSKKSIKKTTLKIREVIIEQGKLGWRFVNSITQLGEGLIVPDHYELVFEKEIENK